VREGIKGRGPGGGAVLPLDALGEVDALRPVKTVKLDVLWVVDHSAAMCQEQRGLAEHIPDFVGRLPEDTVAELRAVTTADAAERQGNLPEPVSGFGATWCWSGDDGLHGVRSWFEA
jgi:hypothetical protein